MTWDGYAGDPQHTAISGVATQPLQSIHWQTPVDTTPTFSGSDLLIHYGSPAITSSNTVIVPVKTSTSGDFVLKAFDGATGTLKWTQSTDYTFPSTNTASYSWTPSYGPVLSQNSTLYYPGAGARSTPRRG